jgi:DNA-binding MarR family transcriptional regulator
MSQFSLDDSVGYTFNIVANLLKKELNEEFKRVGLDILAEQWALLYRLNEKGGINQQELAELTSRDNASVTRSLVVLERKNIIERRQLGQDRRHRYLYLTVEGQQMLPELINCADRVLKRATQGISPRELSFMNGMIQQMIKNLSN